VLRRLATTDVVVCVVPSLLAAVCASIFMRATKSIRPSVRFVLWVQDLVVNAATMLHDAPRTSLVLRAARAMELFAARAADAVVVCSPGFADYFASGGLPRRRLVTVNNWVDVERIPATPAPNGHRATRFLYAGNVGYSQGFETLVEAARLRGGAAEVLIVGEGNEAGRVRELAEHLPNLTMRPPVPIEDFPALLASADAHIVLQRRAAAGVNLPSKIGPYLASGRPIVASLDLSTPAAELLRRSGGAVLVPPEDPHMLADAMQTLGRRPDIRRALARSGRAFAERELDRKHALTRLEAVVLG
jgi:colanic acid biosynthesis glycosyl transferase WcaI